MGGTYRSSGEKKDRSVDLETVRKVKGSTNATQTRVQKHHYTPGGGQDSLVNPGPYKGEMFLVVMYAHLK